MAANHEILSAAGDRTQYAELTTAFGQLQSGDTLYISGGRHQITPGFTDSAEDASEAPLRLRGLSNVSLIGLGASAEIFGAGPGDFLFIRDCSDIRIKNIRFSGDRPEVTDFAPGTPWHRLFSMVLLSGNNRRIHVRDCHFLHFGNHAFSHLHGDKISSHITVENCVFENGGDAAIGASHDGDADGAAISGIGSHWRITGNRVLNCVRGFEVENSGPTVVRNVHIRDNHIVNASNTGIMIFPTSWRAEMFRNIHITDNHVYNKRPMGVGIFVGGGTSITIRGNHVTNTERYGICASAFFSSVINAVIEGNMVTGAGWRGLQVASASTNVVDNVIIRGNSITDSAHSGIWVIGRNVTITANHCRNNARTEDNAGIKITASEDCLVIGNRCWDSTAEPTQEYGILIGPGSKRIISRNNYCHGNRLAQILNRSDSGDFLGDRLGTPGLDEQVGFVQHSLTNSQFRLQWPATAPHLRVESSDNLRSGSWQPLSSPRNLSDSSYTVTLPQDTNAPSRYFRLQKILPK